jgi:hypothetical protein
MPKSLDELVFEALAAGADEATVVAILKALSSEPKKRAGRNADPGQDRSAL